MACWRHHFPLLCVKQWHADVSTFHCVSLHTETHFVPDPHMGHVETDSVWRVIEGKWCFGSGIRIRYPDHHRNLMEWSLCSWLPSHYISFKSVHNFLSNPANRQTNKQTNRQTDKQTNRQTDKRGWIHNIRPTTLANVTRQSEMANTSPRHMPVLGNVHAIKIEHFDIFCDVISLLARVFILLIDTATQEVPMKNIWKKLSVQFLRYAIELLHVKHRTRHKWR